MTPERFDYALVGGGLQNGLIALALRHHQPAARIAMIERGDAPGGNHTWCFHAGDVPTTAAAWLDPLVVTRWPGYDVAFPAHRRRLDAAYACVTSEHFAGRVVAALDRPGSHLYARSTALTVGAEHVAVRSSVGTVHEVHAHAVIDARGPELDTTSLGGWQKFLGIELALAKPHGLDRPMLMDATVVQRDGFRFMYVLPLADDRVLVEDTYFSDGTHLDVGSLRDEIAGYVAARGWRIAEQVREETGVLPLPWRCDSPSASAPLVAGYAGGWFHPVTGYSFPIATRLAELVASRPATKLYGTVLENLAASQARQMKFALQLNRMLFRWFPAGQRYHVLERFYRLPEPTIRRFYALELTALDRARILVGRPPRGMSIRAALGLQVPT